MVVKASVVKHLMPVLGIAFEGLVERTVGPLPDQVDRDGVIDDFEIVRILLYR